MIWLPWRRCSSAEPEPTTRDSDAKRALERARLARREASSDLAEFQTRSRRSREERAQNHFSQVIFDAMKGKTQ